jgi:uncharacterized membrane protein YuzA (DUF378 family)
MRTAYLMGLLSALAIVTAWGNTGITDPAFLVLGLSAVYVVMFKGANR